MAKEATALNAFEKSLLACHGALYRYARALSRDPAVAEDLVQEAYRKALSARSIPFPATEEVVRPWLFTIARNQWFNDLRRAKIVQQEGAEHGLEAFAAPEAERPDRILARRMLQSEVRDAVDSLPEWQREVVVLREMENLSYEQMAQLLDVPVGTVMSRLYRARTTLKRALSRFSGAREGVRP